MCALVICRAIYRRRRDCAIVSASVCRSTATLPPTSWAGLKHRHRLHEKCVECLGIVSEA